MKQGGAALAVVLLSILSAAGCKSTWLGGFDWIGPGARRIYVADYVDKLKGGWIGQMAGAGWGAPTEFKYRGAIVPQDSMPRWTPQRVNQFNQDDLYVEMTFLRTLETHGLDVSARQAGIDFASTAYPLWHGNRAARNNLRVGIAPPDSGHPHFNAHADDIDYQIESDFAGLIAPGMPAVAIQLGEKFGRMIGYGDGLYGGQFIAAMYTEAFFQRDPAKIVKVGLRCIPERSQYRECISDVLRWYSKYPDDWTRTWRLVDEKYRQNRAYRRFSCGDPNDPLDIDAKINGAYVVIGLLYGRGDPDRTIIIATRCGQDSDCNPSSAAGILFTSIGFHNLPEKYKIALDPWGKFTQTQYDFPALINVCTDLARQVVTDSGGQVQTGLDGRERFVIPLRRPHPETARQSWNPEPPAGSRYSDREMAAIRVPPPGGLAQAVSRFAPGWEIANCGDEMTPGLYPELRSRRNVLVTCPPNPCQGCVLSRRVQVPAGKTTVLKLVVGHDPRGDWDLIVSANGQPLVRQSIGPGAANQGWNEVGADLSEYAGQSVELQLVNFPTGWHYEAGYWDQISLQSN